jgi:alkanesulfonate monooxygenase SsuD/methylene tetrahydromethanopterin reductase-like flavin-dependent oxidoreductase (luciferase family)
MLRPLKIGLVLPTAEGMMDGRTPRWTDILAMARLAEAVRFDSVWVADHLLVRFADDEPHGLLECWSLLAGLATATERVALGPLVGCLGWRNPALLAKMADTVDEISGGRLILGLGAGWHRPEFDAFGYAWDHRASRFEEAIQIVHALLRQGHVDFDGTYYAARECELRPRGPRRHGPPILIGTFGPRMLQVTARYADAWNAEWTNQPEKVLALQGPVDAACAAVGRDPATLERTAGIMVDLPGRHDHPAWRWIRDMRAAEGPASGSSEELANLLRGFADVGITHVQVWLAPDTLAGVEAFAPVLEVLDQS